MEMPSNHHLEHLGISESYIPWSKELPDMCHLKCKHTKYLLRILCELSEYWVVFQADCILAVIVFTCFIQFWGNKAVVTRLEVMGIFPGIPALTES